MPDYRTMFDYEYAKAWDLKGDTTLTISEVKAGAIEDHKTNTKDKCPIVYFEKATKGLPLNKTNAKTIAGLYGNDTEKWTGKDVTLYPTQVQAFGATHDAIRIRNVRPSKRGAA